MSRNTCRQICSRQRPQFRVTAVDFCEKTGLIRFSREIVNLSLNDYVPEGSVQEVLLKEKDLVNELTEILSLNWALRVIRSGDNVEVHTQKYTDDTYLASKHGAFIERWKCHRPSPYYVASDWDSLWQRIEMIIDLAEEQAK